MGRACGFAGNKVIGFPFQTVTDFTISLWYWGPAAPAADLSAMGADNFPTAPRNAILFKYYKAGPADTEYSILIAGVGGTTNWACSAGWHHAAITRTAADAYFFHDGVKSARVAVGAAGVTFENIYLGGHYYSGAMHEHLEGYVAEFAWWNVVLTDVEVAMLAKRGCPALWVNPSQIRLYAPCWGAASVVTAVEPDLSGKGVHGTIYNSAAAAPHAPIRPYRTVA